MDECINHLLYSILNSKINQQTIQRIYIVLHQLKNQKLFCQKQNEIENNSIISSLNNELEKQNITENQFISKNNNINDTINHSSKLDNLEIKHKSDEQKLNLQPKNTVQNKDENLDKDESQSEDEDEDEDENVNENENENENVSVNENVNENVSVNVNVNEKTPKNNENNQSFSKQINDLNEKYGINSDNISKKQIPKNFNKNNKRYTNSEIYTILSNNNYILPKQKWFTRYFFNDLIAGKFKLLKQSDLDPEYEFLHRFLRFKVQHKRIESDNMERYRITDLINDIISHPKNEYILNENVYNNKLGLSQYIQIMIQLNPTKIIQFYEKMCQTKDLQTFNKFTTEFSNQKKQDSSIQTLLFKQCNYKHTKDSFNLNKKILNNLNKNDNDSKKIKNNEKSPNDEDEMNDIFKYYVQKGKDIEKSESIKQKSSPKDK